MTPTRALRARMRSSVDVVGEEVVCVIPALQGGESIGWPWLSGDALKVGVHHHLDEPVEIDCRRPSELLARLGIVANQVLDFGRTDERGIKLDVFVPVEPCVTERDVDQIAHRM